MSSRFSSLFNGGTGQKLEGDGGAVGTTLKVIAIASVAAAVFFLIPGAGLGWALAAGVVTHSAASGVQAHFSYYRENGGWKRRHGHGREKLLHYASFGIW